MRLTSLLALTVLGLGSLAGACTVTTNNVGTGDDGGVGDDATTGDDGGGGGDGGMSGETSTDGGAEAAVEAAADAPVDAATEAEAAPAPQTYVRLANWAPDAPAAGYDFCVAPHGTTTWTGPVLAGQLAAEAAAADGGAPEAGLDGGDAAAATALSFPSVTDYFGVSPNTYDVEIVAAGSSCATAVSSATTLPALAANGYTTFAIVGDVSPSGSDHALEIVSFTDDSTASAGNVLLRFINAAPDLAAVDFGQGTLGATSFAAMLTNVQFGKAGSTAADAGTLDTNDYLTVGALATASFSVHTSAGGTTDTATASNVTVAAGGVVTMALVNGKNGGPAPQLLLCTDNAGPSASLLGACSIVSP